MPTFQLVKSMDRPATEAEEQEAMELCASNGELTDVEVVAELETRWKMPVTRFFVFRMWCNLAACDLGDK